MLVAVYWSGSAGVNSWPTSDIYSIDVMAVVQTAIKRCFACLIATANIKIVEGNGGKVVLIVAVHLRLRLRCLLPKPPKVLKIYTYKVRRKYADAGRSIPHDENKNGAGRGKVEGQIIRAWTIADTSLPATSPSPLQAEKGGKCEFAASAKASCWTVTSGHSCPTRACPHAAPTIKVGSAQKADFAKSKPPKPTYGVSGPELPFEHFAENYGSEPTPEVSNSCCARSQHEKCGMSEKFRAAAQRKKRPFVQAVAWIRR